MGKLAILSGGAAGIGAACSVMNYVSYATQNAVVLQAHLSRAPELTDKVLEAANKAAEGVGEGNLWKGLLFGAAAGVFAGLALYDAMRDLRHTRAEVAEGVFAGLALYAAKTRRT